MVDDQPREEAVRMGVGEVYEVTLDENPTTGYCWTVQSLTGAAVEELESEYEQFHRAGVGGGGRRVLRFRPREAGTAEIELALSRPWGGESIDARRLTLHAFDPSDER